MEDEHVKQSRKMGYKSARGGRGVQEFYDLSYLKAHILDFFIGNICF